MKQFIPFFVFGSWKIAKGERLELYLGNFPAPLSYKIKRLNNDELYLQSYVDSLVMKFNRVK